MWKNMMQKILENSGVALFILIGTIIGTAFVVVQKVETNSAMTKELKDDFKVEMKTMSKDIEGLKINMAVLNSKNNIKYEDVALRE